MKTGYMNLYSGFVYTPPFLKGIKLGLLTLLVLINGGCEKAEIIDKAPEEFSFCKLKQSVLFPQSLSAAYSYDDNAQISRIEYIFSGFDDRDTSYTESVFVNTIRDVQGRLVATEWIGSDLTDREEYVYNDGKIARIDSKSEWGIFSTSFLSNAEGLVSRKNDDGLDSYSTYEYDEDNVLIKTSNYDFSGELSSVEIVKPNTVHKSPESVAINSGLPFEIRSYRPFTTPIGGEGTIHETYLTDFETGELYLYSENEVYDAQVDENGYLISYKLEEFETVGTYTHTLEDCDGAN